MTLDRPRLADSINTVGINQQTGVIGPVIWLYREGLGRFLFSATPRPGFLKTAVAHGARIQFTEQVGRPVLNYYTIGLHANAIAAPGPWMLWVKNEPGFHPPAGQ